VLPTPALQELPERHTLIDALTAMIQSAKDGTLKAAIEALPGSEPSFVPRLRRIEVRFFGPVPQAVIEVLSSTTPPPR
jgi:hypothetical protein